MIVFPIFFSNFNCGSIVFNCILMSLKAETFQNPKNHLVQNSCFLYNNPIKKIAKNRSAKGTPLQALQLQL